MSAADIGWPHAGADPHAWAGMRETVTEQGSLQNPTARCVTHISDTWTLAQSVSAHATTMRLRP